MQQVYYESVAAGLNLLRKRYNKFKFIIKTLQQVQVYYKNVIINLL